MKSVLMPTALMLALTGCGAAPASSSNAEGDDGRPQRIVSLNLCADQLVVELADRDQIAGLTRNADDADMSAVASRVAGLPVLGNAAEQILEINPDLVIGMPTRRSAALGALQGQNYRALDLQTARSLDDIYNSIRLTADAVGHSARGAALVADMQRDLTKIGPVGKGRVAAYYQRRGFMTGTGTLIDDMMTRMGLVNLAAKMGKGALAQLSLEEMVAAQPDFIIMASATQQITDQGSEMLHHDALRNVPRLYLAEAMTVCGGPAYVDAARALEQQISAFDRAR